MTRHFYRPGGWLAAVIIACTPLFNAVVSAEELDENTRVNLQITLKDFVNENSSSGSYPFFDPDEGEMLDLKLKKLHPVIFARDGYYMMCADFVSANGNKVLIDYIVVGSGDTYAVTQQIKGRRSYLTTLFNRVF